MKDESVEVEEAISKPLQPGVEAVLKSPFDDGRGRSTQRLTEPTASRSPRRVSLSIGYQSHPPGWEEQQASISSHA
jgi:hypothetical protein